MNEPLPVFVILTREAPPTIPEIHDHMPVILPEEIQRVGVSGGDAEAVVEMAIDTLQYHENL